MQTNLLGEEGQLGDTTMSEGSTPHPNAPGLQAGIDEEMIRRVVAEFYARARTHEVLGPIFEAHVSNWDHHIDRIAAFWSSVLLMTGRYDGRPMPAHARIAGLSGEHFDQWLALFRETVQELCPPPAAALFTDRAERIADTLEAGIAQHRSLGL